MGCKYNQKTALTTSVFIKIELFVPLRLEAMRNELRAIV